MWEGKHFHKYNKYQFWSKSKVQYWVFHLNKNNLQDNALNINKSISGQHSKINMNTMIYILFLAATVINLLANVTASQKSCFLGLVLCLTWKKGSLGKMVLQLYGIVPIPSMSNRVWPGHVFNMCFEHWFREQLWVLQKKKTKHQHPPSFSIWQFGLSWTLKILVRWGVFSLQSTIFYARGRVARSQTVKQCWRGKGKLWSLVGKGHNRALGQRESQLLLPARNIFPPM